MSFPEGLQRLTKKVDQRLKDLKAGRQTHIPALDEASVRIILLEEFLWFLENIRELEES